jgi:hypothetical protein
VTGDPFVYEDTPVLRIINEFYNVTVIVVRFNEVSLGSTSHLADKLPSSDQVEYPIFKKLSRTSS